MSKECKNFSCKIHKLNNGIKCKKCVFPFFQQKLDEAKKHIKKFTK